MGVGEGISKDRSKIEEFLLKMLWAPCIVFDIIWKQEKFRREWPTWARCHGSQ